MPDARAERKKPLTQEEVFNQFIDTRKMGHQPMINTKKQLTKGDWREVAAVLRSKASLGPGVLSREDGARAADAFGREPFLIYCDFFEEVVGGENGDHEQCKGEQHVPLYRAPEVTDA